ncbi:HK97-gp10 family putative phage morphogenesis protein [Fusibacter sp. JL298sf-3]
MSISCETVGFEALIKALEEKGLSVTRYTNKALKRAAEPVLKDMIENAPEDTGRGKEKLKIGRPSRRKGRETQIVIGIDKGDLSEVFYLKFHEFGTSKMPAEPFMLPALEKNIDHTKRLMIEELRKVL